MYVLFGLVTAGLVVGGPGQPTDADQRGALEALSERSAGRVLLVVLAVGLASYAAWRLVAAVRPPSDDGWLHRSGYALSGAWHLVLTWASLQFVVGDRGGNGHVIERWSARLLGTGLGTLLVGVAGTVIVGVGVVFGWRAVQQTFVDDLDTSFVDDETHRRQVDRAYRWLGTIGWTGRAFLVAACGAFAVGAAIDADIDAAAGFDGLLRRVASAPAGSIAVVVVAGLFVAYGTFCALSAPARTVR